MGTNTASFKKIAVLEGHKEAVWSVAWHPTLPLVATSGTDKSIRIWRHFPQGSIPSIPQDSNKESQNENKSNDWHTVAILENAHKRTVRSCDFSPDGAVLASASFDSTTSLWENIETSYANNNDKSNLQYDIKAATAIKEEREMMGIEDTGLEDIPSTGPYSNGWECVATLEGHENEVKSIKWSSSGSLLATCGRDKSVWIWGVEQDGDFQCLAVLQEHEQDVKCVAWHPTDEYLVSGSYDNSIRVWQDDNQDDWYCSAVLNGHSSTVWSISFSQKEDKFKPVEHKLVSVGDDLSIRFWSRDIENEQATKAKKNNANGLPSIILDREKQEWKNDFVIENIHKRSIYSVDWGKNGYILTCGGDNTINLLGCNNSSFKPKDYSVIFTETNPHGPRDVNCVSWSPTNPSQFASAGDDGSVIIWELCT